MVLLGPLLGSQAAEKALEANILGMWGQKRPASARTRRGGRGMCRLRGCCRGCGSPRDAAVTTGQRWRCGRCGAHDALSGPSGGDNRAREVRSRTTADHPQCAAPRSTASQRAASAQPSGGREGAPVGVYSPHKAVEVFTRQAPAPRIPASELWSRRLRSRPRRLAAAEP